jgi:hypothetical protein
MHQIGLGGTGMLRTETVPYILAAVVIDFMKSCDILKRVDSGIEINIKGVDFVSPGPPFVANVVGVQVQYSIVSQSGHRGLCVVETTCSFSKNRITGGLEFVFAPYHAPWHF